MADAETPNGKGIEVRNVDGMGLLEIVFTSGGKRPKEFEGMFTDNISAHKAISKYLKRIEEEKPLKKAS